MAEHPQPIKPDHILKAAAEGNALASDLLVKLVVGDKVDILDSVVRGDWNGVTLGLEKLNPRLAKFFHCDSEVKAKVLNVALVGLEISNGISNNRFSFWAPSASIHIS